MDLKSVLDFFWMFCIYRSTRRILMMISVTYWLGGENGERFHEFNAISVLNSKGNTFKKLIYLI